MGAGLHSFCPHTGEIMVQPLGYGDSHGSYGVGQSTGSIQFNNPPVMVFSSFLFSLLPDCKKWFFICLIFSELVNDECSKNIHSYITYHRKK